MKTVSSNKLKALVGAMLLSWAVTTPVLAESHAVVHSVTGSGVFVFPRDSFFPGSEEFSSQTTISARQAADGTVEGTLILQSWSESSPAHLVTVFQVNCLSVTEDTAYVGAVALRSSNPFVPPGTAEIGYVTDTNGAGPDLTLFGPASVFLAPGQDCTARPDMVQMFEEIFGFSPLPIVSGNFVVR